MAEPKRRKSQFRNYAETALGTSPEDHAKRLLIASKILGGGRQGRSMQEGKDIQKSVRGSIPESTTGSYSPPAQTIEEPNRRVKPETPAEDRWAHYVDSRGAKRAQNRMSEAKVQSLQRSLNAAGFTDEDGNELTVDGDIGPDTRAAIAKALKATEGIDNLSTRKEVRAVQAALRASGIKDAKGNDIRVDGILGPRTKEALRNTSSRIPQARPEAPTLGVEEDRATREKRPALADATLDERTNATTPSPEADLQTALDLGDISRRTQPPSLTVAPAPALDPRDALVAANSPYNPNNYGPGATLLSPNHLRAAGFEELAGDLSGGAPTIAPAPSGAGQMASTMVPWSPGAAEEHAFRRDRNAMRDLGNIALHSPTAPPYTSRANLPLPDAEQFQTDAGGGIRTPRLTDPTLAGPSSTFTTGRPANIPGGGFSERAATGQGLTKQRMEESQRTRGAPQIVQQAQPAPVERLEQAIGSPTRGGPSVTPAPTAPDIKSAADAVRQALQEGRPVSPVDAAVVGRDYIARNPWDAESVIDKFKEKGMDIRAGAPDWNPPPANGPDPNIPPTDVAPSVPMLTPEERAIPFGPDAEQSTIGSFSPPPAIAPPTGGYPAPPDMVKDYMSPGVFRFDSRENAYTAGTGAGNSPGLPNVTGPETYTDDPRLKPPMEALAERLGSDSRFPWTHAVTPQDFEHSLDLRRTDGSSVFRKFDQAPNLNTIPAGFQSPPQVQRNVPGQAPVDPRSLDLRNEGLGSKAFVDPNRSLGLSLGPNLDNPRNPNLPGDLNGLYQNGLGYAPDPNAPSDRPGQYSAAPDLNSRLGDPSIAPGHIPEGAFKDLLASAPSVNTELAPTSAGTQVARSFVKPGESLIRPDVKVDTSTVPAAPAVSPTAPAPTFAPTDSLDHTLLSGPAPTSIRAVDVTPAKIPDKLPSFIFDQPDLNAGFLAPSTAPAPVIPANTPEEAAKAAIIGLNPPAEIAPAPGEVASTAPVSHTRGFNLKKPGDEAPAVMAAVTPVPEKAPNIIAAAAPEEKPLNILQQGLEAAAHPVAAAKRLKDKAPETAKGVVSSWAEAVNSGVKKLADVPANILDNVKKELKQGVNTITHPGKLVENLLTGVSRFAMPAPFSFLGGFRSGVNGGSPPAWMGNSAYGRGGGFGYGMGGNWTGNNSGFQSAPNTAGNWSGTYGGGGGQYGGGYGGGGGWGGGGTYGGTGGSNINQGVGGAFRNR